MCDTPDYPVTEKSAEKVVSDPRRAMTQRGRNVARRSAVSPSVSPFIPTSLTIFFSSERQHVCSKDFRFGRERFIRVLILLGHYAKRSFIDICSIDFA